MVKPMKTIICLFAIFSMLFAPLWGGAADFPVKDLIALINADAPSPPDLLIVMDYSCDNDAIAIESISVGPVKAQCMILPELAIEVVTVELEYQPLQALS